jgi:protein O-GlcNAc transferase
MDVRNRSDVEVARTLRRREIDIAVDLGGFTGGGRPGILSHRPAPIQASYMGYPSTMGTDYIDYLFADRHVVAPEHDVFYAEKVVRLPDTYWVTDNTRPIATQTPTRADVGLPDAGFVFCCFNNSHKITPEVFEVWMRLLREVDGSALWLLEGNAAAVRNLRNEARNRGVSPLRLVFAPRMESAEHLARHRLGDLMLDTLPYNGHTTASDALWAGLPVVTCSGSAFPGRVAGSLLRAAGLPELITENLHEYEALALRLARTPPLLSAIRTKLLRNRGTCPLFDTDRFRRHFESAYLAMWERHQRGERPESFSVQPIP